MKYDRAKAVEYAHKWAFDRNPEYADFSDMGGDCTNFVSQCLLSGGARMNLTPTYGWYYKSMANRAPAWAGVKYLYNFLISNKAAGPYAREVKLANLLPGDVIQLCFKGNEFSHSLLVVETGPQPTPDSVLIATHSHDSDNRALGSYTYLRYRCLSIDVR